MRSATIADISDSIAPSIATVTAGMIRPPMSSGRKAGRWIAGRPLGMPPKRVPMVSTSRPSAATAAVPRHSATIEPGMRVETRFIRMMIASVPAASAAAIGVHVPACAASEAMRGTNSPGT